MTAPADLLAALSACLCENLASTSAGAPGACCVVATAPVVPDCCPGIGWVRVVSAYPSQAFPQPDPRGDRCRPPVWAMVVELGVDRCAPSPCEAMSPACCEMELAAALDQLSDFDALRLTLVCCLPAATDLRLDEIVLGVWTVGESQGGCLRSTMQATVRWVDSCSCP